MRQRPDIFTIDPHHHLAQGLVFAGLGANAGSTRYHDSSLFGNPGTISGATWMHWNGRQMLDMGAGGTANNVTLSNAVSFAANTPFAFSAWVYRPTGVSNRGILGSTSGLFVNQLFAFGGTTFRLYDNGNVYGIIFDEGIGAWGDVNHICIAYNGATSQQYVNGIAKDASIDAWSSAFAFDVLGNRSNSANYSWNGWLGDVILHNRALSPTEIALLADPGNIMLSGMIREPQRKWWPVVSGGGGGISIPVVMHHRRLIGAS